MSREIKTGRGCYKSKVRDLVFVIKNIRWILAIWIAFVFLQSLFFKFSGSAETQHIFGVLGTWSGFAWFAKYGAYGVGVVELIASILLFTRWWGWGALLAFEVMCGAILFHLFTPLGIEMPVFENGLKTGKTDGGMLFIMACLTWLAAILLLVKDWTSSGSQLRRILPSK